MPGYRRNWVEGGCYFFTVTLLDRRSDLLVREVEMLREAVRGVWMRAPFTVDAWVVLPDHMHCVWTLPEGDADFAARWRAIKTAFSKGVPGAAVNRRGERGVWQRRYWEHTIRDGRDYAAHVDYVHFNPVRHGFVPSAGDWAFSSFRRAVAAGRYPAGWAGGGEDRVTEAGERGVG